MKILTWNINGIRAARRGRPLKEILDSLEADVICLQETKVTRKLAMWLLLFPHLFSDLITMSETRICAPIPIPSPQVCSKERSKAKIGLKAHGEGVGRRDQPPSEARGVSLHKSRGTL